MDKNKQNNIAPVIGSKPGIYVQGMVISNSARKITMKNGDVRVAIKTEVALDPGVIALDRFVDPDLEREIQLKGDEVVSFPKIKKFEMALFLVKRVKEYNNQMTASDWELVPGQ